MASPLNPVTVSLILKYISPPSNLSHPIPSHLLSLPLLQRHHFLSLDPADDSLSYLSWPSSDRDAAFDLFESLSASVDLASLASSPLLPVSYTADQESLFAHAELRSATHQSAGIRLVFLWDGRDEAWKYHNVALMPFPPNASDFISKVSLPHSVDSSHDFLQETDVGGGPADTSEDAYWDAYGQGDDDREPDVLQSKDDMHANSEDAYWAQYASVQGSGDSTLPSPLPASKRKLQSTVNETDYAYHDDHSSHYSQNEVREAAPERILDIPYTSLNIQPSTQPYDPHSPPSPDDLSARLKALSSHADEHHLKPNGFVNGSGHTDDRSTSVTPIPPTAEGDAALKDTIAGTYKLWKTSRLASPTKSAPDSDEELFLRLVREAISH